MPTTETPVLDLLARMNADSIDASTLDAEALLLVRIAALVAVDAPPVSYLMHLGAANDLNLSLEDLQGTFAAVAPIVGTAKVAAAATNLARALGIAVAIAEEEDAANGRA